MQYFKYLFVFLAFLACKPEYTAQEIVDASIKNSGLNVLDNSELTFKFRNNSYSAHRNNGDYNYTRIAKSDSTVTKDVLSNKGFRRFINGEEVELTEKRVNQLSNSVNSVHYFSVLPYGLNDKAVIKKLLGSTSIKGIDYYKIEVTFNKVGGGDDFDDVFLYWFNKETLLLEYIAYKYHTSGGGIRFRDMKKEHGVNGTRFLDYQNLKPKSIDIDFYAIDKLYEEGSLLKVSDIELENIQLRQN
ncbi:hypothetical protein SAMN04489761_0665 [Tenacibaculum sp. MAR_2009_124]|uniref:DUF6503 family protein n=1 Tax=Tenacibaculum sp. MAR_2009_124 TaxID=1250059 RepID=UPI00089783C8|nr:DUF6503 family protein [Tenacibaculum sp. MAR_2009_124]SEB43026.1 hypothetical protein SAMN04489761_0665 [Tenacibaculum sp. MAR_2009_124]